MSPPKPGWYLAIHFCNTTWYHRSTFKLCCVVLDDYHLVTVDTLVTRWNSSKKAQTLSQISSPETKRPLWKIASEMMVTWFWSCSPFGSLVSSTDSFLSFPWLTRFTLSKGEEGIAFTLSKLVPLPNNFNLCQNISCSTLSVPKLNLCQSFICAKILPVQLYLCQNSICVKALSGPKLTPNPCPNQGTGAVMCFTIWVHITAIVTSPRTQILHINLFDYTLLLFVNFIWKTTFFYS